MKFEKLKTYIKFAVISGYNKCKYMVFNKRRFPMLNLNEICKAVGFNVELLGAFSKYGNKQFFICNKKMFYLRRSVVFASTIENETVADCIIKQGGIIISEMPNQYFRQITVKDERKAWIKLCSLCRIDSNYVIAVTGSTGKTSAKQFIYHVVKAHERTFCAKQNMNTYRFIGSLIQLSKKDNKVIVQEVDEGDPHVVDYACEILRPNISVITNIGLSHLQNFGSQDAIFNNISEIENHMGDDSIVIFNYDDEYLRNHSWNHKYISVSLESSDADCYCVESEILDNGHMIFKMFYQDNQYCFELPIPGKHNIYNAMYSFLCGTILGESRKEIANQLKTFKTSGVRQNILKDKKTLLYIDCFNAAPNSVKYAIDTVCSLKGYNHKIAVLSDMYEFGEASETLHRDVGRYIHNMSINNHLDIVLCYGESAKYIAEEIKRNDIKVFYSNEREKIEDELKKHIEKNNVLLFKGSRGTHLEFYIKKLFPKAYIKVFMSDWLLFHDI